MEAPLSTGNRNRVPIYTITIKRASRDVLWSGAFDWQPTVSDVAEAIYRDYFRLSIGICRDDRRQIPMLRDDRLRSMQPDDKPSDLSRIGKEVREVEGLLACKGLPCNDEHAIEEYVIEYLGSVVGFVESTCSEMWINSQSDKEAKP